MNDADKADIEGFALVRSMVGRKILNAEIWEDVEGGQGGGVTLDLDDGRSIAINGWGHDWWGVTVEERTP